MIETRETPGAYQAVESEVAERTIPATVLDDLTPAPPIEALIREWTVPGAEEAFRGIYTRSGSVTADVLAVCSAIAGEGRTTVSLGLATTIAQDFPQRQVLLVEADLTRPVLAADFGVTPTPGLGEYLLGGQPLQFACRSTSLGNLDFMPAGEAPRSAGRLLASSRMAAAVDIMRQSYDVVIFDTPPVLTNSDSLVLSDIADGVIFVVRSGVTALVQINRAVEQLDEGKMRGFVLNGAHSSVPRWLRRLCGL